MSDELFLLSQQGVPRCGVRMHGLHLRSSKGSGLGFAAGLAVTCFTDAGKSLDPLSSHCGNKVLLEGNCLIHSSYWKVGCPQEVRGMKGLCGGKESLALTITAEGLIPWGRLAAGLPCSTRCLLLSLDPGSHLQAGNCKSFALPTFQCQQDVLHRVYLLMGWVYLPKIILCCQNDMKEL